MIKYMDLFSSVMFYVSWCEIYNVSVRAELNNKSDKKLEIFNY